MKLTLVVPPAMDHVDGRLQPVGMDALRLFPPYGVYLLAAVARDAGHEVAVVDLVARGSDEVTADDIAGADLVGVSATSIAWPAARAVLGRIRALDTSVPIVTGGVHPTYFDDWVLRTTPADFVVRGDGELPLLALCEAITGRRRLEHVPSLSWHDGEGGHRNADGPSVERDDLDRWIPAFDLLPDRTYWALSLETSRGCAFDCSFCSTPHRRRWRGGEPGRVVDRVEAVLEHRHRTLAGSVYLVDDEFCMNPPRAAAIGHLLTERAVDVSLLFDARAPDLLRPGLLEALAPHFGSVLVGAECGYDEGLVRIGKGTTCELLDRAAGALADHAMAATSDFSFILGLPWESTVEVLRTVEFAFDLAERHGVRILLNWYCQIPGSHLFADAVLEGAVTAADYDRYGVLRDPVVFWSGVRLDRPELEAVVNRITERAASLGPEVPRPSFAPPSVLDGVPLGSLSRRGRSAD